MKKSFVAAITAISILSSGCSTLMHSAPPREAWRQKGIEHKQCDFSYLLPLQDVSQAASFAITGINLGFSERNSEFGQMGAYRTEYALVGLLLAAPFIASSVYGFSTAKECRAFRNDLHYRAIHLSK